MGSLFGGNKKQDTPAPQPTPVVTPSTDDPERIKKIGRSALIATSTRGVLGNANVSGKKLS